MEHEKMANRVDKWLRSAIEHERRGMKEYGSMTTLERIARLRAQRKRLEIVNAAHERAEEPATRPKPVDHPRLAATPRANLLKRVFQNFFSRGNR